MRTMYKRGHFWSWYCAAYMHRAHMWLQCFSYLWGILKKKKLSITIWLSFVITWLQPPWRKSASGGSLVASTMPTHLVSNDMKARIPVLFHQQGFNVKEICHLLDLKKSIIYRTLRYARAYGVPYNPHSHQPGRKRILSQGDVKFVVALLNRRHCIYYDEIQEQLCNERGISISISSLLRTLHCLHYSHKGVSVRALERDDLLCSAFMNRIADKVRNPDMLMFVDEAARNKRTSGRTKGWSLVGKRCVQRRCFGRGERFSILPVLTLDGIITYDIVPGSVNSQCFLQFLCELVVRVFIHAFGLLTQHVDPPFQSLPMPPKCPHFGQLQYPPFRRSACTCQRWWSYVQISHANTVLNAFLDCKLLFLPPYSPDLNPIEQAFSAIKSYLKRYCDDFTFSVIDRACQNVSSDHAWGYFRASGYVV